MTGLSVYKFDKQSSHIFEHESFFVPWTSQKDGGSVFMSILCHKLREENRYRIMFHKGNKKLDWD